MKFDYEYMEISGGVLCKIKINDCWVRMTINEYASLEDWTKNQYDKVKKWCEENIIPTSIGQGGLSYTDEAIANMCDIALYGKVYPYQARIILAELNVPYTWNNKDIVYTYELSEMKNVKTKIRETETEETPKRNTRTGNR